MPAGAPRELYFIVTSGENANGTPIGNGGATWYDVKVEQLGEIAEDLPLEGITLQDYVRENDSRKSARELIITNWRR